MELGGCTGRTLTRGGRPLGEAPSAGEDLEQAAFAGEGSAVGLRPRVSARRRPDFVGPRPSGGWATVVAVGDWHLKAAGPRQRPAGVQGDRPFDLARFSPGWRSDREGLGRPTVLDVPLTRSARKGSARVPLGKAEQTPASAGDRLGHGLPTFFPFKKSGDERPADSRPGRRTDEALDRRHA